MRRGCSLGSAKVIDLKHLVLLQAIFTRMFHVLMNSVKKAVEEFGHCSFELIEEEKENILYLRFWQSRQFCRVAIAAYGKEFAFPGNEIYAISNFLAILDIIDPVLALVGTTQEFRDAMNTLAHTRLSKPLKASKKTLLHVKIFDFADFKDCLIEPFTKALQQIDMIGIVETIITRLRTVSNKRVVLRDNNLRVVSSNFMTHIHFIMNT